MVSSCCWFDAGASRGHDTFDVNSETAEGTEQWKALADKIPRKWIVQLLQHMVVSNLMPGMLIVSDRHGNILYTALLNVEDESFLSDYRKCLSEVFRHFLPWIPKICVSSMHQAQCVCRM